MTVLRLGVYRLVPVFALIRYDALIMPAKEDLWTNMFSF
jgi:hypothetical protein